MAKGEYAIQISGKVQQAIDALQEVQKELKGVGGAVKKGRGEVKGMSIEFLAFGATLVGTATSVTSMGAALETSMFRSRVAVERLGMSVDALATSFNDAGMAASEMLPVAAQFARFGIAKEQIEAASKVAFEFGLVTEMGTKKAGVALSAIAGAMGQKTEPEIRRLASGLTALERAYPGTIEANMQLLQTLGPTAQRMGITESALTALNTVMLNHGVQAGAASGALTGFLESFRFGTDQAKAMAMSFGLSGAELEKFGRMTPNDQMTAMFKTMRSLSDIDLEMRLEGLGIATGAARDAIVKMVRSGEDLETVLMAAQKGFADGSALAGAFGEKSDTLQGAVSLLWKELRSLGSETGKALAPIATLGVKLLTALVQVIKIFPTPIRAAAVAFVGLSGAVMLVSKFLGTTLLKDFKGAMGMVWGYTKSITVATAKITMMTARTIAMGIGTTILAVLEGAWIALKWAISGTGTALQATAKGSWAVIKVFGKLGVATLKLGGKMLLLAGTGIKGLVFGLKAMTLGALGFVKTAVGPLVAGLGQIAVSAWAAIAPLLPFIAIGALVVAAIAGIAYGIYKLVQVISDNWVPIWNFITAGLTATWEGLKLVGGAFVELGRIVGGAILSAFQMYWSVLKNIWTTVWELSAAIWDGLVGGLKTLWGWVTAAGQAIAAPFVWLYDKIVAVGDAIGGVVGMLFGSSMFHLKEGVSEVMPALTRMEGAFLGIGRAAGKVGLESHIPDDIRVRIAEPAGVTSGAAAGGLSDDLKGKQAVGGPAGSGREGGLVTPPANLGATGAGEGSVGTVRVVTPVTIMLDNEVLGRAIAEHEIDVGRERFMNTTLEALRGTGR